MLRISKMPNFQNLSFSEKKNKSFKNFEDNRRIFQEPSVIFASDEEWTFDILSISKCCVQEGSIVFASDEIGSVASSTNNKWKENNAKLF